MGGIESTSEIRCWRALSLLGLVVMAEPAAAVEETLFNFNGSGAVEGTSPHASLVLDPTGALYGTATTGGTDPDGRVPYGGGVVFKLSPPSETLPYWTSEVLHAFKGGHDGAYPYGRVIRDSSGALFGTTSGGDGSAPESPISDFGTVFKLVPTSNKSAGWQETVLYRFKGGVDGADPAGNLAMDPQGALIGSTSFAGTSGTSYVGNGLIFKLTPAPAGKTAWKEQTLYRFKGGDDGTIPTGGLIPGASGVWFGTTLNGGGSANCSGGCGTVYQLTAPGIGESAWTKKTLYAFQGLPKQDGEAPGGGLLRDSAGALYGTTYQGGGGTTNPSCGLGCGVVFKLTPPVAGMTAWTETVMHRFGGSDAGDGASPSGGLIMADSTSIYGTTEFGGTRSASLCGQSCGTIFKLSPPASIGGAWNEEVIYDFTGGDDGGVPTSGLVYNSHGALFGTASVGGTPNNAGFPSYGVMFRIPR